MHYQVECNRTNAIIWFADVTTYYGYLEEREQNKKTSRWRAEAVRHEEFTCDEIDDTLEVLKPLSSIDGSHYVRCSK